MGNRIIRMLVLVLLISLVFTISVYAEDEGGEPRDVGFVEKAFITIINSISSALDMEDFSIDHLIYGKGDGGSRPSTWEKSKYAFNPVNGNLFYDIYRDSYGVFRNIGIMIVNILVVFLAIKGLRADATSKDYFKAGILALLGTTLMFTSLPVILDYALMIREYLLDFVYSLSAGLSGTDGGGFIEGLRSNASSDTATLQDALFYLAGVLLNIYFVFIYISMGVSFIICMWLSPVLITTSETKVKDKVSFFKYIAGIIFTPVIDAALLVMPLVMVAKSESALVTLATFAAIIPTRTWLRKLLGVGSGVSEMMGMGFAFMGGRMVGSAVGGVIGAGKRLGQGVEHAQKSKAFSALADEEEGVGGASGGFGQQGGQQGPQAQQVYGSISGNSQGSGTFAYATSASSSSGGYAGEVHQTSVAADLASKYGHKGWFRETGIQMTNRQKADSERLNAVKSVGSAAGGLAGRVGGMGVGATILSGYSTPGVAIGAMAGGEVGDAVGSKLGQLIPFERRRFSNEPYSLDFDYRVQDGNPPRDMIEDARLLTGGEGNFVVPSGGGGVAPSSGGGYGDGQPIEVALKDGYKDFKVRNGSALRVDYDNTVPKYANAVMDTNKDALLNSAMDGFASKNNISINGSMFSSAAVRNKAHDTAKQQIVSDLISGQSNEEFRDAFAKPVHSQEVSKVVMGDSKIKAEELADRQLDEFAANLNSYIESNYQDYVADYMQNLMDGNKENA